MKFLQLPEFLEEVFKYLDNKSLYKCLFVNRFWSQNVVGIFWRNPFRNYSHFTEENGINSNYDFENNIFREIWKMLMIQCSPFKSIAMISLDHRGFNELINNPDDLFISTITTNKLFERLDLFHSYCIPSEIINRFTQISTQFTKLRVTTTTTNLDKDKNKNSGMDLLLSLQKNLKNVAIINCSNLSKILQILNDKHSSSLIDLTIEEKEFDSTPVFSSHILDKLLYTSYKHLVILDLEIHSPHIKQFIKLIENTNNNLVHLRLFWYYHKDPENLMNLTLTITQYCTKLTLLIFKLSKETIHLLPTIFESLNLLIDVTFYNASNDSTYVYDLETILPECGMILPLTLKYLGLSLTWTISSQGLERFFKNAEKVNIKDLYLEIDCLNEEDLNKEEFLDIFDHYVNKGVGTFKQVRVGMKPENYFAHDIKIDDTHRIKRAPPCDYCENEFSLEIEGNSGTSRIYRF
ncbi:8971_t:CDS:2 [Diversispora eburnea]|uniref:8971_t:CDS:1 n=1 Tax=Diversispora eburnea TaxID=1213867 RepID=A0A9N8WHQ3_9GLOM|nr:8971_t:CDS:2 [Diversispora eburnea]